MDLRQVRAIVTDSRVLSTLEPDVITGYPKRTGWSDAGQRRTHQVWARMLSDGIATVVVPNDRGYADYPVRMTELLTTLAVVEDRSQLAVLADLLEPHSVRPDACCAAAEAAPSTVIERLAVLAEKATPRPWEVVTADESDGEPFGNRWHYAQGVRSPEAAGQPWVARFDDDYSTDQWADADLIVAAINALPDLLAVARAADTLDILMHEDGKPEDGYRFRELVLELRAALGPLFRKERRA
jgi:hypothetical protein